MTAKILLGDDGTSKRVLQAWEYDTSGNVAYTWKGDTSRTGPDATEVWGFVYDDPADPTQTTVTDPRGDVTVYDFDRDPASDTPRAVPRQSILRGRVHSMGQRDRKETGLKVGASLDRRDPAPSELWLCPQPVSVTT